MSFDILEQLVEEKKEESTCNSTAAVPSTLSTLAETSNLIPRERPPKP